MSFRHDTKGYLDSAQGKGQQKWEPGEKPSFGCYLPLRAGEGETGTESQAQLLLGHTLFSLAYLITSVFLLNVHWAAAELLPNSAKFPLRLLLEVIQYITSWGRRGAAELVLNWWTVYSATLVLWSSPPDFHFLQRTGTRADRSAVESHPFPALKSSTLLPWQVATLALPRDW